MNSFEVFIIGFALGFIVYLIEKAMKGK